jgi:hypothetical protein
MDSPFTFPTEFTGPSELRSPPPRRVSLTGHGFRMAIAAAILLALAAAGVVWIAQYATQRARRDSVLHHSGRQTNATIARVQTSGTFEPRVDYTFTLDGVTYAGHARLSTRMADTLSGTQSLTVLYFPANPAINYPAGLERSPHSDMALLVAPAISALLGCLLFVPLFVERRMAAEGVPVIATVTKCARARYGYFLNYAFHLESGTSIKGRGWYHAWQEPGTAIWAICLPKTPRRNLPYPLNYCRVIE